MYVYSLLTEGKIISLHNYDYNFNENALAISQQWEAVSLIFFSLSFLMRIEKPSMETINPTTKLLDFSIWKSKLVDLTESMFSDQKKNYSEQSMRSPSKFKTIDGTYFYYHLNHIQLKQRHRETDKSIFVTISPVLSVDSGSHFTHN